MSWGTRTGVTQSSYIDVLNFRLVRWTDNGGSNSYEFPEGTSQTFKAGQPVKLSAGVLIACVDNDTVGAGIALKDSSGVANTPIPVIPFRDTNVFIGKCLTTPARATHVGNSYNLDLTSTTFSIDLASSAQPFWKIIDLPTGFSDSTKENYQKAYVICASAARQLT